MRSRLHAWFAKSITAWIIFSFVGAVLDLAYANQLHGPTCVHLCSMCSLHAHHHLWFDTVCNFYGHMWIVEGPNIRDIKSSVKITSSSFVCLFFFFFLLKFAWPSQMYPTKIYSRDRMWIASNPLIDTKFSLPANYLSKTNSHVFLAQAHIWRHYTSA